MKPTPALNKALAVIRAAAPGGLTRRQISERAQCTFASLSSLLHRAVTMNVPQIFSIRAFGTALYFGNKKDRDAFDMREYCANLPKKLVLRKAPCQTRIQAECAKHKFGCSAPELREAVKDGPKDISTTLTLMVANGRLFSIGRPGWMRYFASKESLEAVRHEVIQLIEEQRNASHAAAKKKMYARTELARRAKRAAARALRDASPPKPKKQAPKTSHKPLAIVTYAAAKKPHKKASPPSGPIVVPPHVKVQVCPGFKGDRFSVTGPVVGGFSTMGIGRYYSQTK